MKGSCKKTMYEINKICNAIIWHCKELGIGVSNQKLQKLLFLIQEEFKNNNKQCFNEYFEMWDYGPVIPSVYKKYRVYAGGNIPYIVAYKPEDINFDDLSLIYNTIEKYKEYSFCDLYSATKN